ncbi:MAG: hypothetical protein IKY69_08085, partial [Bacteroidaceae bacterium]|nr:hypothetical protein [Bacteroidaceae bacterium]
QIEVCLVDIFLNWLKIFFFQLTLICLLFRRRIIKIAQNELFENAAKKALALAKKYAKKFHIDEKPL